MPFVGRSVSSDEDGGGPARLAASEGTNQTERDPQRAERAIKVEGIGPHGPARR
jgi:hypothetical protein